jgi:hypothetical protein
VGAETVLAVLEDLEYLGVVRLERRGGDTEVVLEPRAAVLLVALALESAYLLSWEDPERFREEMKNGVTVEKVAALAAMGVERLLWFVRAAHGVHSAPTVDDAYADALAQVMLALLERSKEVVKAVKDGVRALLSSLDGRG